MGQIGHGLQGKVADGIIQTTVVGRGAGVNLAGIEQRHGPRAGDLVLAAFSQAVAVPGQNKADNVQIVVEMFWEVVAALSHPADIYAGQARVPVIYDICLGFHLSYYKGFSAKVL
ncbi:hypothetical protein JCM12294_27040 [Desulfocicer niacini]